MINTVLFHAVEQFVQQKLQHDTTGHSMDHIHRVVAHTKHIAQREGADVTICVLAALLHDVIDDKISQNIEQDTQEIIQLLASHGVNDRHIQSVLTIIQTMSFSHQLEQHISYTLEAKVVQDADRLDALGAIGIARTFIYAGSKGSSLYHPDIKPRTHMTKEAYRQGKSTAINHFYEKLLLLKDKMHTQTAREMAQERHEFMQNYLEQFFNEWNGVV